MPKTLIIPDNLIDAVRTALQQHAVALNKASESINHLAPHISIDIKAESYDIKKLLKELESQPQAPLNQETPHTPNNPDYLPPEAVGEGYRLLDRDEIVGGPGLLEIEGWAHGNIWTGFYCEGSPNCTYRTKLTREELAKARDDKWHDLTIRRAGRA